MNNEQRMRERFEKWITDIVLRRISEPGQWFGRDDVGGYIDPTVHDMWRGYVAGEQARDAEVQALKHALTELADCAEDATKRLPYPRGSLDYAIWQARAALAGGEEGETE